MNNEMTTDNMSNEEVIEVLKGIVFGGFDRTTRKERQALDLAIKALKEERPRDVWVSVSERLPNNRDWYLGLFKEPDTGFIGLPYICDYVGEVTKGTTNEGWILRHCTDVDNASDYFRNLICVAWQPLPEPYQKGGEE